MNNLEKSLLEKLTDLHKLPSGAFSLRKNGESEKMQSTKEIEIKKKADKQGIDIIVAPNVKGKSVHIPVIISVGGLTDLVYNDFYIGENADVLIVAGCGIHNATCKKSEHNGVHTFHLGKNSKVEYIERHIGEGDGEGEKVLNPITKIILEENSHMIMESTQLGGVSSTIRKTTAKVGKNAILSVKENILTTDKQWAKTDFKVELLGENSRAEIVSHSVARDNSVQEFKSNMIGKAECFGHVECDGMLLDNAVITSTPTVSALNNRSSLVHEASIGKISGEAMVKLMSLGLTEKEAEDVIIEGFLLG
ncbi:MAG: SufD family Fe-S cluster assembly protein [Clostridia bacterium]|nr:SufD family Fe-S cluster assembly protein [Clostridia bacterium]